MEKQQSVYDLVKGYNAKAEGDTKQNQGLDYLSWAAAWEEILKVDPMADWDVEDDPETGYSYWKDGSVRVWITIKGQTRKMRLPVMTTGHKAIAYENITSVDWNRAMQRCFVKCAAKFGLGLSVYRGEDMTEDEKDSAEDNIMDSIKKAQTLADLTNIWNSNQSIVVKPRIKALFTARKSEIEIKNKKTEKV